MICVTSSLSACSFVSLRPLYSTMKAPFLIGAVAKRPRPVRERPIRKVLLRAIIGCTGIRGGGGRYAQHGGGKVGGDTTRVESLAGTLCHTTGRRRTNVWRGALMAR